MQPTELYRALRAKVAQWVWDLKQVCLAWTSYFAACRAWEEHSEKVLGQPKQGRNLLTYTTQAISRNLRNAGWIVPSGPPIQAASKQAFETRDQARIVPHATHHTVEVIGEQPITLADRAPQWVAGMDLGVNKLAVVPANQSGFVLLLVHCRPLKALNQLYNKRRALYQSSPPDEQQTSRRLDILSDKRKRQVEGYLHVASRRVVEHLVHSRIGILVIGKHGCWKQEVNLGKRKNQTFVFLPHSRFIQMLADKAQLVGIQVNVTEERYTSKCSFLDHEPLADQERYVGKRLERGLFQTATSRRLNADATGACNRILKAVPDAFGKGRAGVVVHPVRLSLTNRRLASYIAR